MGALSTSWSENAKKEERIRVLGQGSHGFVWLVKSNAFPNRTDKYFAKKTSFMRYAESVEKEIRILRRFSNTPNIVDCINPYLHLESMGGIEICSFYMEYSSGGTLKDVIERNGGRMRECDVRCCARMILRGLVALHAEGYVHCDLKPANILAFPSRERGEICELKIADFDLAKEPGESLVAKMFRGTAQYMSPESVGLCGQVGPALDVWSLGCVVLAMFGVEPHGDGERSYEWTIPGDISEAAKGFVSKCMEADPLERWSAERLMRHPFVAEPSFLLKKILEGIEGY